jgi:hypothetical protein
MRFITKATLIGFVAVAVMSAVGSASASAAKCTQNYRYLCIENTIIGSFTFTQTTGVDPVFDSELGFAVTCSTVKTAGSFESGKEHLGVTPLELKFSGCKVTSEGSGKEEPQCEATEFHTASLNTEFGASDEDLKFTPTTGEGQRFMTVNVYGASCVHGGEYVVYGNSIECTLSHAEEETATKELACESAKSHLELRHGTGGTVTLGPIKGAIELSGTSKAKKYSLHRLKA